MNDTDRQYERHLCEQVVELSRLVYIANSTEHYPIAKQVMADHSKVSMEKIRDQIQENIDFTRMSLKYLLLDVESLRREKTKLKGEK